MRQVVIFGAGCVGRGLIAPLFCDAGWSVTFLDTVPDLVGALSQSRSYSLVTLSATGRTVRTVRPVEALAVDDPEALSRLLAADVVVSCVGVRNLPAVADRLALAVSQRLEQHRPPLDVLVAENLHDAAAVLRGLLAERLPGVPAAVLDNGVGLMDTSIGRMIPVPDPTRPREEATTIEVEPYALLPYDAAAGRGLPLGVPGLVSDPTVPFAFYNDRKLYIHNAGHYFAACLGGFAGCSTIAEAITDPGIRYLVRGAMVESAVALSRTYGVALPGVLDHVDDLLYRFGNVALGDTVERVGRDPVRKFAAGDRVLGALGAADAAGLPGDYLSLAVAAGAVRVMRDAGWSEPAVWAHLDAGLAPGVLDGGRRALVGDQIHALASGYDFATQVALLGRRFEATVRV